MFDAKARTLLTLVREGSYTKAAEALNLSQPAVSHQMRQLEEEFGVKLFHRNKKGLQPTPEGRILIKYARRALAVYENARQELADSARSARRFTVAITPTVGESLALQTLARYCTETPNVHIKVTTGNIKKIYDKLNAFEADIAIVEGHFDDPSLSCRLLDTDYLCLAVSPEHPFAKRSSISLQDMKKERLIMRSRQGNTRMLFERYLENNGESIRNFDVIMELDNVATIKELVERNLGITVIAHSACLEDERAKRLVALPIENASMVREINLVTHRDFNHPEILDAIQKLYHTY